MIEAKGNYAALLSTKFGRSILQTDWLNQAKRQIDGAKERAVEWYFHDPSAAVFASTIFANKRLQDRDPCAPVSGRRSETEPEDQMMSDASYWMTAQWGARVDPLSVLAERLARTVDEIQAVHPRLEAWEWGDRQEFWETEGTGGLHPFAEIRKRLISAIERNAGTEDDRKPNPLLGYWLNIMIDGMAPESIASLSVNANAGYKGGSWVSAFMNEASFELGTRYDPSLVTYESWRSIFLMINETWEATWAEASPDDIRPFWTAVPVRCAWMSYVSPYYAPLITPPPSVIAEHRPNGGLFLAATRDLFKTDNPAHLAAAREIEAALQPLNRIPNPNDAPYRRQSSSP